MNWALLITIAALAMAVMVAALFWAMAIDRGRERIGEHDRDGFLD